MDGEAVKGYVYENKMCGLIALRLCADQQIKDFKIGTNVLAAKPFDDIVIIYYLGTNETQPRTVCMQLKHKEGGSMVIQNQSFYNPKGDFSLLKYADGYIKISDTTSKKLWNGIDKGEELYVLYTNANVDPKKCDLLKAQDGRTYNEKLMSTGNTGTIFKFMLSDDEQINSIKLDDKKKEFFEKLSEDPKRKTFFDKLLLFANQNNESGLDEQLNNAIQTLLKHQCHSSKLNEIRLKYINFIEHKPKHKPLSKKEVIDSVIWFYAESFHIGGSSSNGTEVVDVWNRLTERKRLVVLTEHNSEYINAVREAIRSNDPNHQNYLHLNLKNIENNKCLSEAWRTVGYPTLLLEIDDTTDIKETEQCLVDLVDVLADKPTHKLVLICKIESIIDAICKREYIKDVPKFVSLMDLEDDEDLMSKQILYYGITTTLGTIVSKDSNLKSCFKAHHILTLLMTGLKIGSDHKTNFDFYLDRKIGVTAIKSSIFKCKDFEGNIMCISGDVTKIKFDEMSFIESEKVNSERTLNDLEIIKMCPEDPNTKTLQEFNRLKKALPLLKMFLVNVENEGDEIILKLITSFNDSAEFLKPYLYEEEVKLDARDDVTILAGEPGMGKSTFCEYLWRKNINDIIPTLFITQNDLRNSKSLYEIFKKFQMNNSDLTTSIFKYHRKNKNLLVIIDAFDELFEVARGNALKIIDDCTSENYSVLVTTRPATAAKIEEKTSVLSQKLKPFDRDQQVQFLREYWIRALNLIDKHVERVVEFSLHLLNRTESSVNDKERSITGIPLQCRMIAEIFTEHCEEYVTKAINVDNLLKKTLNIVELYEQFIDKKMEIFLVHKMELGQKAIEILEEDIKKSQIKHCQTYALLTIFSKALNQALFNDLFNDETKAQSSNEKLCAAGIFSSLESRTISDITIDFPVFVHRTYAEYFAALYLSEKWEYESERITEVLSSREYDTVRYFFDLIMAKECPLITAVIRNDIEQINNEISFIDQTDKGGRGPLHLVAMWGIRFTDFDFDGRHEGYNNLEICKLLLEAGIDITNKDLINQWTALKYADSIRTLHIVNEMIDKEYANDNDLTNLMNDLYNSQYYAFHDEKRGNTLLHHVAMQNHNNILNYLINRMTNDRSNLFSMCGLYMKYKRNKKINCINRFGYTSLHTAVERGYIQIVDTLLAVGANVDAIDKNGDTPLHWAVREGHILIVERLLSSPKIKSSINKTNAKGLTPLHLAAGSGHCDALEKLIAFGANIKATDLGGNNVLHSATEKGNTEIVLRLLNVKQIKDNLNFPNGQGQTSLHLAAAGGHVETVETLLAAGIDLHAADWNGNTVFHNEALRGDTAMLRRLLEQTQFKDVDCLNRNGQTPLHMATQGRHLETVMALIEAGANLNAVDENGNTLLHQAARYDSILVIQRLLNESTVKENVNRVNHQNQTALHTAVEWEHVDIVELLLEAGIDAFISDKSNSIVLHWAAREGRTVIVQRLLENATVVDKIDFANADNKTPLYLAVEWGRVDTIILLLTAGADAQISDDDGNAMLHRAARDGPTAVVEGLLTNSNVKNNIDRGGQWGWTPLHFAVMAGKDEIVDFLLKEGADANVGDQWHGETPLHWAAYRGQLNVLIRLLDERSVIDSIDRVNEWSRTALHLAAEGYWCVGKYREQCRYESRLIQAAQVLLEKGADVNRTDSSGRTPAQVALETGHLKIAELIEASQDFEPN